MNNYSLPRRMACCTALLALFALPVQAHKGHAGPMVSLIKDKAAIKTLLFRKDWKISQRKQALKSQAAHWAGQFFNEDLDAGEVHTFFLAKDRANGQITQAAIIGSAPFHHGEIRFIIGMDAKTLDLTQVAVLGANKVYLEDLQQAGREGWISSFKGMDMSHFIDLTHKKHKTYKQHKSHSLDAALLPEMRYQAVMLAALLHQLQQP